MTQATSIGKPLVGVCLLFVAGCAAWSLLPLGAATPPPRPLAVSSQPTQDKPRPLQLAAFQTPLWVAPIPPPVPPPPPAPPPPLRLQLIAITIGDADNPSTRGALIFDPDQNKLFTISAGQKIGDRTIVRITDAAVELKDSVGTRQLSLKSERTHTLEMAPIQAPPVAEAQP